MHPLLRLLLIAVASLASLAQAHPTFASRSTSVGRIIVFPDPDPDTSLKQVPDADHPYIAPGPMDMRGPCPALNTLANHGYLPRNGIVTPEQVVTATTQGFNLGHKFAKFLVSFATLARGNPEMGLLSIGGESPMVTQSSSFIDGIIPGGIAKHGRFEGDLSISRNDFHLGNHINFQQNIFDMLLSHVSQYGDFDVSANRTILNIDVMSKFKSDQYLMYQAYNPSFTLDISRQLTVFSEVSLVLNAFANGTTNQTSMDGLTTIFRDQMFPENFYRSSRPLELDIVANTAGQVMHEMTPQLLPGMNVDGVFVVDHPVFTNFVSPSPIATVHISTAARMLYLNERLTT
jgi:hypothetical protein